MDPASFGLSPSACTAAGGGPYGPDRITQYAYDAADRIMGVVSGYGVDPVTVRETTYLPGGRIDTQSDGKNNRTTFEYDGYGRLWRIRYPDPSVPGASSASDYEEFGYNLNSQVTSIRRRSGDVIFTPRDALGRVTVRDMPGGSGEDVYFSYDNQGRILGALYDNVPGNGITQTYDGLGRLESRTVFGRQMSYLYDLAGRRKRLTYPGGFYVTYDYTNVGELLSVADSDNTILAAYGYDATGSRTGLVRPNGTSTGYVPDALQRMQQLTQDVAGTGFDLTATFSYSPAGQIATKTMSNDAAYTWVPPAPGTLSSPVDGLNQLTSFAGVPVAQDLNGNLRTGLSNMTYTFDALGQLRDGSGSGTAVSVDYDPMGMLRRVTSNGVAVDYLYDGGDLIAQYDAAGNLLRRFVHGAGSDEPLVVYEGGGTGNKYWLHTDERGSIIAASDASGVVSQSVKYSAYGESASLVSAFGYTGQLYLQQLQLYYYKARMYSPKAGRFLQPDPIGYSAGLNLYAYVGGDPVNLNDPSGLSPYCFAGQFSWDYLINYDTADVVNGGSRYERYVGYGCTLDIPGYSPYDPLPPQHLPGDQSPVGGGGGGPQSPKEQCTSPPVTATERSYARQGDRRSFWESRNARGDPMASMALSIYDNLGLGMVANAKLITAISGRSPASSLFQPSAVLAEVNRIGVELMQGHVAAVDAFGAPSPSQIAQYHWNVFSAHGLGQSTFGGTPYFGAQWEANITAGLWLQCH